MSHRPDRSDFGLSERLQFSQLDEKSRERIREIRPIVDRELPSALDRFYANVRATAATSPFFRDESHISHARGAQLGHWFSISSANFDGAYVDRVRAIGMAHSRIGLEPRWYIGGYALILENLIEAVVIESWPKLYWNRRAADAAEIGARIAALIKAALLDMDFSISVYLEEAEKARVAAEQRAKAQERELVTDSIGAAIGRLAANDISYRLHEELPEGYQKLQSDFNAALDQLETSLTRVSSSSEAIRVGTQEISTASAELSQRTENQAASLEETSTALEDIAKAVRTSADELIDAQDTVASAKGAAEVGEDVVRQAIESIRQIESSSRQIGQIISVIDEIALQTNLLALNAGVEAARAGDAGRGFGVVASEVRALAQRSAGAAKEIAALVSASATHVDRGVDRVVETGRALASIRMEVDKLSTAIANITSAAHGQATGLQQIFAAMTQLDQVTQQNAAMAERAAAASLSLAREGRQLAELVNLFEIGDAASAERAGAEIERP